MINIETTTKSIQELVDGREVNTIIQGTDCFCEMQGKVASALRILTNNDIASVDHQRSHYGDINKLGTATSETYTFAEQDIEMHNLYCEYIRASHVFDNEQESIHWGSVYDGIEKILSKCESGSKIAIGVIGHTDAQIATFRETLEELAKENDNELPDVDIVIFEH